MLPLTEKDIRASFINASQRERKELNLPAHLDSIDWESIDYLGWRDPKAPAQGYVVLHLDGVATGILLRKGDVQPRTRPQCAWCEDVELPNDVAFFSVKRGGAAGRRGDTVGTLVCADFECSVNVRRRPTVAYVGFDVEAAKQHRIDVLRERSQSFVRGIRGTD
jgi:hypothetical protein